MVGDILFIGSEGGFLPSVKCRVGPNKPSSEEARLLFDSGASNSFITNQLAKKLNLPVIHSRNELVTGIGGKATVTQVTYVQCNLFSSISSASVNCQVRAIDKICGKLPPLDLEWCDFPEVDLLKVTEDLPRVAVNVDCLVGNDLFSELVTGVTVAGECKQYMIWDTVLGTAVSGRGESNSLGIPALMQSAVTNDQLSLELKRFWDWESLGVVAGQVLLSPKEKYAEDFFKENVTFDGKRYEVKLPFDPDLPKPINNYASALAQFKSLERTLCRNLSKKERYTKAMEQYIKDGHIERVFSPHPDRDANRYFLPHHGIWRDNAPSTKARVVFNGSSPDVTGYTLNNSLLPGCKKQADLCDVLTRYRTFEHTLTGDIKQMFLQISIWPADRDYLSLLWRTPGSTGPIEVWRKAVLPFGLNCAPHIAISTVEHHLNTVGHMYPEAAQLVRRQIFVDDVLLGGADVPYLIELRRQVSEMLEKGSFHLCKWLSNDPTVLKSIPEQDRAAAAPMVISEKETLLAPDAVPKTLGIQWDPMSDCFEFQGALDLIVPLEKETMRTLASRSCKVFDPLGLASPVLIQAKVLMQRCWQANLTWEDSLPSHILEPWLIWIKELMHLHFLEVPRHLYLRNPVRKELHIFSDASTEACAAAAYARTVDAQGRIQVTLIASKTKLAPLQQKSVPRLELMGALLAAKLARKLENTLDVHSIFLWTDNSSVIQWLRKAPSNWSIFVGNRVAQITELYSPEHFRHVGSHENAADVATRGMGASQLIRCRDWFEGPHFLHEQEELWPRSPIPAADLPEVVAEQKQSADTASPTDPLSLYVPTLEPVLMEEIFDNIRPFSRNLRLLAYVIRFAYNAQPSKRDCRRTTRYPTLPEHKNAMNLWARYVQELFFVKEMHTLTAGAGVTSGPMKQLQPFFDETLGVVRVGGRLQFSGLGEEAIHPVILPAKCKYVESYILYLHRALHHLGGEGLLAQVRLRYWLLQGRKEIKRILWRCKPCYRLRSPPFAQTISPLPSARTAATAAWLFIGIDYAGPLYVKKEKNLPSDKQEFAKVWILLGTDLATRSIHLEWLLSMTTEHLINALQRLIARRGHPRVVYCDNAKQFKRCDLEMKRLYQHMDWEQIERYLIQLPSRIEFRYSAPIAPHWGGVWERLVRSVKVSLKSTFGNRRVSLEDFRTGLANSESCINSRPLTMVSDDKSDPLPITPGHLTNGRGLQGIPDFLSEDKWETKIGLQWKLRQKLHTEFWNRWRREYLQCLQPSQIWTKPGHEPKVNEVVLLNDEPRPRNEWAIARVLEVFPGKDGKVRSVLLFVKFSDTPIRRDVRKIYHFEESASEIELQTAELRSTVTLVKGPSSAERESTVISGSPAVKRQETKKFSS